MPQLSRLRALALALAETLLQQRTTWRPVGLLAAWGVLMLAATQVLDPLKSLDWRLLQALDVAGRQWPSTVELVDLEWNGDPADTAELRRRVAGVLEALHALQGPKPRVVVLDVTLNLLPIELDRLNAAVVKLGQADVPLVVATGPEHFPPRVDRQEAQRRLGGDAKLYGAFAEFGHTDFVYEHGQQPSYRPCEPLRARGCLLSVPDLVAARFFERTAVEDADALPVVFAPGPPALREGHVWRLRGTNLEPAAGAASEASGLGRRIVVIGNLELDRVGPWSGPEILAWAIADAVAPRGDAHVTLLRHPLWAVASALAFGGLALGLFVLLRRRDPLGRHITLAAVAGAAGSLVALALVVLALRRGLQVAHYQVAYSLAGVAIASLLGRHAAIQAVLTRALYTSVSGSRPAVEAHWDVFVSYSHSPPGNIARVRAQIVEPLRRCRVGDRPLEVFFDESAIRIGTTWYSELAEGIERSRCVVAVYTSDYFRKSFCLFEMRKAVVRDIADRGQTFRLLPIVLDADVVPPPEFSHLQYGKDVDPGRVVQTVCQALKELGLPVL